ncbi:hypothetical protein WI80_00020 [Burkholderia ubonensis]|uniref:phage integrase family protein n=1 Tax=Burkholderia TaxID=32008 RepID=UPI0005ACAFD1|nr:MULTISPECIES: phage integrase family protein [Burkholderia]KVD16047.1 hypothetical protein WI80_00020 [Burkholderia ubonensis]KVU24915.1 hypothetical protein WK63_25310 [Burkholderia ubonensis]
MRDTLTIAVHFLRLKPGSLRRDVHAGAAAGRAMEMPTPEAVPVAVDPDAVYSERELGALYVETYPPVSSTAIERKVARNRRPRDRQDAALARMEASLVGAPRPEHMLDDWFDAKLVARLAAASATTFAELLALIRARRLRWFRAAQRLAGYSPRAARRVVTRTLERLIDQLPDLWHVSLQTTTIYVTTEQKRARP